MSPGACSSRHVWTPGCPIGQVPRAPLERLWESHARIEPAVAEVPSPDIPIEQRGEWLPNHLLQTGQWRFALSGSSAPSL